MLHNGEFVTDGWMRMERLSRRNDSRWRFRHNWLSHTCIDTSATMTAGEAAMAHSAWINMLQDTATHLQHTATHCKTLQYTCWSLTCRRWPRARRLDEHAATQCNTLATHRNTLQHTATHCNTSTRTSRQRWPRAKRPDQHIATHCNTLATHCNTPTRTSLRRWPRARRPDQQSATQYNTQATHCNTLQHTATHCNTPVRTSQRRWPRARRRARIRQGVSSRRQPRWYVVLLMSHVTHMNGSCHTYEWVMLHIRMSHVTYEWVMPHIRISHETHTNESCHADMSWTSHVNCKNESCYVHKCVMRYRVATFIRIDKIIGLFCKRALQKRRYTAEETYNFIDPTDHSHPISAWMDTSAITLINCGWVMTHE